MSIVSIYAGTGGPVYGLYSIKNIYTGTAGATSSTVDLGATGKAVAFRGEEDFFYLPVSSDSDTVSDSTGAFVKGNEEVKIYMQDKRYLAIIRRISSGDIWIKELGGRN